MQVSKTESSKNREIVSRRVLNFPCELVFKAWTDPVHLVKWWGPKGFRNTFEIFDLKPGGQWKFVMHGPDGTDYPNLSVFKEIVPNKRIVFDHICPPEFQGSGEFEAMGNKTQVTLRMLCATDTIYNALKGFCPEKNEENFDRLEAELATMSR